MDFDQFYNLQNVRWLDVREQVLLFNPVFGQLIDELSPDRNYPLIKARYQFGELILNHGKVELPINLLDNLLNPACLNQLNYSTIPLFMVLNKTVEVFIQAKIRVIPLNLFYPGSLLGLFETLNAFHGHQIHNPWSVSSGARNIFTLPKISEAGGFKRLKLAYNLDNHLRPNSLTEHWALFRAMSQHPDFSQPWHSEVLFFTQAWFDRLRSDPAWAKLKDYLVETAWFQAQFAMSKINIGLLWENFADAISARRLNPTHYLTDQLKHVLLIIIGRWPGFRVANDMDDVAPINALQKTLIEIYQIKHYYPTILHITSLEHEFEMHKYYSLSHPILLEGGNLKPFHSTCMLDTRRLKELIKIIYPLFSVSGKEILKNSTLDFFHVETDKLGEIKTSKDLYKTDPTLSIPEKYSKEYSFCFTSSFWRGCIKITPGKK